MMINKFKKGYKAPPISEHIHLLNQRTRTQKEKIALASIRANDKKKARAITYIYL